MRCLLLLRSTQKLPAPLGIAPSLFVLVAPGREVLEAEPEAQHTTELVGAPGLTVVFTVVFW